MRSIDRPCEHPHTMSVRQRKPEANAYADTLRRDLAALKAASTTVAEEPYTTAIDTKSCDNDDVVKVSSDPPTFDQLTPTEQAAGSLGVHPNALRPIGFMNAAHLDTLRKNNALDASLSAKIEAYKVVASKDAATTSAKPAA